VYISVWIDAADAYLDSNPGPLSSARYEQAIAAGLGAVVEQYPDIPDETLELLTEAAVISMNEILQTHRDTTVAQATIDELSL
jgi:hypothetical protein